jgi:O-methyltransferase domain
VQFQGDVHSLVHYLGHDVFTGQPVKCASVFFLKAVLHDWSDSYYEKILQQLREAAQPHTKLVVMDSNVPYACHFLVDEEDGTIPGSAPNEAPEPLLANYGISNGLAYAIDLTASSRASLLYIAKELTGIP